MNRCFSMNLNSAVSIFIWIWKLWKKILVEMVFGLFYYFKECFYHHNKMTSFISKWLEWHSFWKKKNSWKEKLEMSLQKSYWHVTLWKRGKALDFMLWPGISSCQPRNLWLAICHLNGPLLGYMLPCVTLKKSPPHWASLSRE